MKFLMVTTFYPPYSFGGDAVYVYRLANMLAEHGHEVHVTYNIDAYNLLSDRPLTPFAPSQIEHHPNVKLHPLTSGVLAAADTVALHQLGMPVLKDRALRELMEDSSFDVIHFHNVSLMGAPKIFKYGSAIKFYTLHEEWLVCPMHILWRFDREPCTQRTCLACTLRGGRPPQWWRYTGAMDRLLGHIDTFFASSEFSRRIMHENGFKPPIEIIPYFHPSRAVSKAFDSDLETDTGFLPTQRPYFAFVGRLEKIKGAQVLIDLFKTYDHADLLIAGRGNYEPTLRKLAAGMTNVHFTGFLNQAQLKTVYRRAVACLVPSLCYETFGLVTLESFAVKTPVIVHDLGALPEMISDGGGLKYQTRDELIAAMETLRTQPQVRDEMGSRAYAVTLSKYTEEKHLARYMEYIERAQGKNGK